MNLVLDPRKEWWLSEMERSARIGYPTWFFTDAEAERLKADGLWDDMACAIRKPERISYGPAGRD
jgi:hypothetical protein